MLQAGSHLTFIDPIDFASSSDFQKPENCDRKWRLKNLRKKRKNGPGNHIQTTSDKKEMLGSEEEESEGSISSDIDNEDSNPIPRIENDDAPKPK